ncbi:DUF1467 family protein [Pseudahrensia aquimaris]|uniref:DUF1467 family protein n=1 Tax=Pseudahrensia aquimaris TaxID=744461 RepID=A0ABW3FJR6_9HYPH
MGIGTGIAIYFVVWWTTLFITLPFGMRSQVSEGEVTEGTEPAAPANPQLLKRMLWNTVVAGMVFGLYWLFFYQLGFTLNDLPDFLGVS